MQWKQLRCMIPKTGKMKYSLSLSLSLFSCSLSFSLSLSLTHTHTHTHTAQGLSLSLSLLNKFGLSLSLGHSLFPFKSFHTTFISLFFDSLCCILVVLHYCYFYPEVLIFTSTLSTAGRSNILLGTSRQSGRVFGVRF